MYSFFDEGWPSSAMVVAMFLAGQEGVTQFNQPYR